eukprot:336592-Pelagomonas_calceolata.AAC.1
MMCKATLLILFEFLELQVLSLVLVLACRAAAASRAEKGVGIRVELKLNKVNVPVLRRDLSGIKLARPVWDTVHRDSIRAALVPGRGVSTIRENPGRMAREKFSGTSIPCSRSL